MALTPDIVSQLLKYLFTDARGSGGGGKKNFDHVEDYRYIMPSFLQLYGINLEREEITWYEYKMMLEGCFLNQCTLKRVVEIRDMELPKDAKSKASVLDMKAKYRIRGNDTDVGSMFKTLKGVSK